LRAHQTQTPAAPMDGVSQAHQHTEPRGVEEPNPSEVDHQLDLRWVIAPHVLPECRGGIDVQLPLQADEDQVLECLARDAEP
jgi:hypothetical protein